LPNEVREELNRRLQDGEQGKDLLAWLNALPKVRKVLTAHFGGRPISKQNLSEWKQGGYRDWGRAEETRVRVSQLVEEAAGLENLGNDSPLSERLATVLVAELAGAIGALREESMPPDERWQRLRESVQALAQLRREEHRAGKLRIDQERWERESERLEQEEHEREMTERKDKLCAPYLAATQLGSMTQLFGGDEMGRRIAARVLEIKNELPPGTLTGKRKSAAGVKRHQAGSTPRKESAGLDESPDAVKASQTQSNPVKPEQVGEGETESGSEEA
jgi:hypothetical protein